MQSGHIILDEEHYAIEPVAAMPADDTISKVSNNTSPFVVAESSVISHKILHRIYRTADITAKEDKNKTGSSDCNPEPYLPLIANTMSDACSTVSDLNMK
jgi:hypothetical protein